MPGRPTKADEGRLRWQAFPESVIGSNKATALAEVYRGLTAQGIATRTTHARLHDLRSGCLTKPVPRVHTSVWNYSVRKCMGEKTILALAGSLRGGSLNRRLVTAARVQAPRDLDVKVFHDLAGVPLFDEDLEAAYPDGPGAVADLRAFVRDADGLLLATPEYNQSLPGVMKNAVDWLSRPDDAGALLDLPVAIMGATTGPWGTRYAQKELRHTLTAAGAIVMPQPMLFLPHAKTAFGADGRLTDPDAVRRLDLLLRAFRAWIGLVSANRSPVAAEA